LGSDTSFDAIQNALHTLKTGQTEVNAILNFYKNASLSQLCVTNVIFIFLKLLKHPARIYIIYLILKNQTTTSIKHSLLNVQPFVEQSGCSLNKVVKSGTEKLVFNNALFCSIIVYFLI
jgi:hypothetical protein